MKKKHNRRLKRARYLYAIDEIQSESCVVCACSCNQDENYHPEQIVHLWHRTKHVYFRPQVKDDGFSLLAIFSLLFGCFVFSCVFIFFRSIFFRIRCSFYLTLLCAALLFIVAFCCECMQNIVQKIRLRFSFRFFFDLFFLVFSFSLSGYVYKS